MRGAQRHRPTKSKLLLEPQALSTWDVIQMWTSASNAWLIAMLSPTNVAFRVCSVSDRWALMSAQSARKHDVEQSLAASSHFMLVWCGAPTHCCFITQEHQRHLLRWLPSGALAHRSLNMDSAPLHSLPRRQTRRRGHRCNLPPMPCWSICCQRWQQNL